MRRGDILIITADHGCDPGDDSTDHTREYIPLIIYGNRVSPINFGTLPNYSYIAALIAHYLSVDFTGDAELDETFDEIKNENI